MSEIETNLQNEVINDPLNLGYESMSDGAVSDSLHELTRIRLKPLESKSLMVWVAQGADTPEAISTDSRLVRLEQVAAGQLSATASEIGISKVALMLIHRSDAELDLAKAEHVGLLDVLVAFTIFTPSEKTELIVLASESISRATEQKLGKARPGEVARARKR